MRLMLRVSDRGERYQLTTESGEPIEGVAEIVLPTVGFGHAPLVIVKFGFTEIQAKLGVRLDDCGEGDS